MTVPLFQTYIKRNFDIPNKTYNIQIFTLTIIKSRGNRWTHLRNYFKRHSPVLSVQNQKFPIKPPKFKYISVRWYLAVDNSDYFKFQEISILYSYKKKKKKKRKKIPKLPNEETSKIQIYLQSLITSLPGYYSNSDIIQPGERADQIEIVWRVCLNARWSALSRFYRAPLFLIFSPLCQVGYRGRGGREGPVAPLLTS